MKLLAVGLLLLLPSFSSKAVSCQKERDEAHHHANSKWKRYNTNLHVKRPPQVRFGYPVQPPASENFDQSISENVKDISLQPEAVDNKDVTNRLSLEIKDIDGNFGYRLEPKTVKLIEPSALQDEQPSPSSVTIPQLQTLASKHSLKVPSHNTHPMAEVSTKPLQDIPPTEQLTITSASPKGKHRYSTEVLTHEKSNHAPHHLQTSNPSKNAEPFHPLENPELVLVSASHQVSDDDTYHEVIGALPDEVPKDHQAVEIKVSIPDNPEVKLTVTNPEEPTAVTPPHPKIHPSENSKVVHEHENHYASDDATHLEVPEHHSAVELKVSIPEDEAVKVTVSVLEEPKVKVPGHPKKHYPSENLDVVHQPTGNQASDDVRNLEVAVPVPDEGLDPAVELKVTIPEDPAVKVTVSIPEEPTVVIPTHPKKHYPSENPEVVLQPVQHKASEDQSAIKLTVSVPEEPPVVIPTHPNKHYPSENHEVVHQPTRHQASDDVTNLEVAVPVPDKGLEPAVELKVTIPEDPAVKVTVSIPEEPTVVIPTHPKKHYPSENPEVVLQPVQHKASEDQSAVELKVSIPEEPGVKLTVSTPEEPTVVHPVANPKAHYPTETSKAVHEVFGDGKQHKVVGGVPEPAVELEVSIPEEPKVKVTVSIPEEPAVEPQTVNTKSHYPTENKKVVQEVSDTARVEVTGNILDKVPENKPAVELEVSIPEEPTVKLTVSIPEEPAVVLPPPGKSHYPSENVEVLPQTAHHHVSDDATHLKESDAVLNEGSENKPTIELKVSIPEDPAEKLTVSISEEPAIEIPPKPKTHYPSEKAEVVLQPVHPQVSGDIPNVEGTGAAIDEASENKPELEIKVSIPEDSAEKLKVLISEKPSETQEVAHQSTHHQVPLVSDETSEVQPAAELTVSSPDNPTIVIPLHPKKDSTENSDLVLQPALDDISLPKPTETLRVKVSEDGQQHPKVELTVSVPEEPTVIKSAPTKTHYPSENPNREQLPSNEVSSDDTHQKVTVKVLPGEASEDGTHHPAVELAVSVPEEPKVLVTSQTHPEVPADHNNIPDEQTYAQKKLDSIEIKAESRSDTLDSLIIEPVNTDSLHYEGLEELDKDSIMGKANIDYPTLINIPNTGFSCKTKKYPGYYADVKTGCQVFYICQQDGRHNGFLCPSGSIFHQKYFICDWWYNVNCASSPEYYHLNSEIGHLIPFLSPEESVSAETPHEHHRPYLLGR